MQSTYTNFANFFIAVHEETLAPAAAGSQPPDAEFAQMKRQSVILEADSAAPGETCPGKRVLA